MKHFKIAFVPKDQLMTLLPMLKMLNPDLSDTVLQERIQTMALHNYQCVGVYNADSLIGISGIWILHKIYTGKHLELDNVCILPTYRGQGVGEQLVQWILEYGTSIGCQSAELNCYLGNERGQAFWKDQGFEAVGYHFIKKMN